MWPSIIPLLMACFGMLSHFPVGRTGDPALEHQLVVRVGTAVMFIGNLTWNLLWRLGSTPLQCLQDGGNATLPWGAATHPWGEASVTVPFLLGHVQNAPIRLWQIWLAIVFAIVFKLHQVRTRCSGLCLELHHSPAPLDHPVSTIPSAPGLYPLACL